MGIVLYEVPSINTNTPGVGGADWNSMLPIQLVFQPQNRHSHEPIAKGLRGVLWIEMRDPRKPGISIGDEGPKFHPTSLEVKPHSQSCFIPLLWYFLHSE